MLHNKLFFYDMFYIGTYKKLKNSLDCNNGHQILSSPLFFLPENIYNSIIKIHKIGWASKQKEFRYYLHNITYK